MTALAELSPLVRALFSLWALLLCLVNIGSFVLAAVKKHFLLSAFATLLFVPAYFLWQVLFDFSLAVSSGTMESISAKLTALPFPAWLAVFILATVLAAALLFRNIRYDQTSVTLRTIKMFLDRMPCGICCWLENGRVLFSNHCMDDLCMKITKSPLLNGKDFQDALTNDILRVDQKVWRFALRQMDMDGELLYELIASDITKEYAKTEALKKDQAELSRINQELMDYYRSIDESVARQEILQAKMNIHDEMNRLMLETTAADSRKGVNSLEHILSLWEQNALLLCLEADRKNRERSGELDELATALGIQLILESPLPWDLTEGQKALFFYAAQEAIINAVKHAQAKTVRITIEPTEKTWQCFFINDGKMPTGEITFQGGLKNLARLAENQGASIETVTGDTFALILRF